MDEYGLLSDDEAKALAGRPEHPLASGFSPE